MTNDKTTKTKEIPQILWSNHAYYPYDGPAIRGFVNGEGYINQALRIAQSPWSFMDRDVRKTARVLVATRHPKYAGHAERCLQELASRKEQKDSVT